MILFEYKNTDHTTAGALNQLKTYTHFCHDNDILYTNLILHFKSFKHRRHHKNITTVFVLLIRCILRGIDHIYLGWVLLQNHNNIYN